MAYLDVYPMMVALRTSPEDFEMKAGWYRHIPSRHDFSLDPQGHVQIRAACNCADLAVRSDQEPELAACFNQWQASYWRPLQINREFASHFRPRPPALRMLIDMTARLHRWLLTRGHAHPDHEGMTVPAE